MKAAVYNTFNGAIEIMQVEHRIWIVFCKLLC